MTRAFCVLALVASLAPGAATGQAPERGSARIRIDAVALDRAGAPVMDLKQDEVEVWIGHFRVPIESFTPVTPATDDSPGRLMVLVLDDMTVPMQSIPRVQETARRFVNRMLPGDRIAIVMLNGSGMESTDDHARLFRAIDGYGLRATGVLRLDLLNQQVLKTMTALSRQMAEASNRRKTIVAIGSSALFDRPLLPTAGVDLNREWIAAMQAMAATNVNFYVIDPGGVGRSMADGGANGFARETGGLNFSGTNDLNAAADRIMREAANYYLIEVGDPPVGRGADLRELEVKVLRRGVTMRARHLIGGGS
jgi:VWFA-related protein